MLLGDGVHPSYLGGAGELAETAHNDAGLFYQRDSGYNLRSMLTVDMAEKKDAAQETPDGTPADTKRIPSSAAAAREEQGSSQALSPSGQGK